MNKIPSIDQINDWLYEIAHKNGEYGYAKPKYDLSWHADRFLLAQELFECMTKATR